MPIDLSISVIEDIDSVHEEFKQCLLEACPINTGVEVVDYWHDVAVHYPGLANVALRLLCLADGSCDAERMLSAEQPSKSGQVSLVWKSKSCACG